jgi:hypothetical protein
MVDVQTIGIVVTTISVSLAAIYYTFTLRINMKTQELALKTQQHTLETRKIQLLKEFYKEFTDLFTSSDEYVRFAKESWSDFDDFMKKYGQRNDPEGTAYRLKHWRTLDFFGLMVRDGVIDIETFVNYVGDSAPIMWDRYKGIILEMRRRYHLPVWMSGFEYLAGETNRYRIWKGWGPKTPDENLYSNEGVL